MLVLLLYFIFFHQNYCNSPTVENVNTFTVSFTATNSNSNIYDIDYRLSLLNLFNTHELSLVKVHQLQLLAAQDWTPLSSDSECIY